MADQIIKEYIPENNDRLNQACRKALLALKQPASQSWLYSLQLAEWQAQENGDSYLQEQFQVLMGWEPKIVMDMITHDQGEEVEPIMDWALASTSEGLSLQVFMRMENLLMRIIPNYPLFR